MRPQGANGPHCARISIRHVYGQKTKVVIDLLCMVLSDGKHLMGRLDFGDGHCSPLVVLDCRFQSIMSSLGFGVLRLHP